MSRCQRSAQGMLMAVVLAVVLGPVATGAQTAETAGVVTEVKVGHGRVEMKSGAAEWRPVRPLSALRAGDQVRATGDASAVVLLTGGRGTVRVDVGSSPYAVTMAPTTDAKGDKAKALLTASLGFLSGGGGEAPKALLSTRGISTRGIGRAPEILTPRNGPVLPDSLEFEWESTPAARYTVRIVGPFGVVLEREGIVDARFTYPDDAPALKPRVRYRFQVEAAGYPQYETWFELVDPSQAAEVRRGLAQLEAALGPSVSRSSAAVVKIGALAADGYLHDARLLTLAALASDPAEPALHVLLGNLYLKTGVTRLAAESMNEAQSLLSRGDK